MIDVAAVGDVLDTFPVCASPICCISSVPEFDGKDPDVLAGKICLSMSVWHGASVPSFKYCTLSRACRSERGQLPKGERL